MAADDRFCGGCGAEAGRPSTADAASAPFEPAARPAGPCRHRHRLGIFASASRIAIERLAAAATEESADAGTRIITQERLRGLGPGDYLREIRPFEMAPRTASIDAATDVELLRVPGEEFLGALAEASPTPVFMEATRMRLATTDPSRRLTAKTLTPHDE